MNLIKSNYLDVGLILIDLVLFLIFGPSFGVLFFCGGSFIFLILRRINLRKHLILRRILMVSAIIIGISFLLIESLVISEMGSDDSEIHDINYIVILGAGLRGSTPSLTLKQRLDTGLSYIKNNKDVPILLSGGRGRGEDLTEAEAMKDYLIHKGVSKDRIVLENKSTSTEENLLFSKRMLEEKGHKNPKIMLITSDYHMFRAKFIARKAGFETYGISSESPVHLKLNYMIREYFAIIKTLL